MRRRSGLYAVERRILALDYSLATDISGLAIPATTWTALHAAQSYTKLSASSLLIVSGIIVANVGVSATPSQDTGRLALGGAFTDNVQIGSTLADNGRYRNPFGGAASLVLVGMPAGTHTLQPQIFTNIASTAYCRPLTLPNIEGSRIRVWEVPFS